MQLAVVDIESTSLKGDTGFVLCAGVQPLGGEAKVLGLHNCGFGDNRYTLDRRVVQALKKEMEKYDGWITWNGLLFDLPFINDRLTVNGLPLLEKRFARGLDMMWHAKIGKSTMTSARLDWVAKAFKCPFKKTDLEMVTWKDAEAEAIRKFRDGQAAYNYIAQHCEADLVVTEWVYDKLKPRVQTISKW